jgi:hypothetical protein
MGMSKPYTGADKGIHGGMTTPCLYLNIVVPLYLTLLTGWARRPPAVENIFPSPAFYFADARDEWDTFHDFLSGRSIRLDTAWST